MRNSGELRLVIFKKENPLQCKGLMPNLAFPRGLFLAFNGLLLQLKLNAKRRLKARYSAGICLFEQWSQVDTKRHVKPMQAYEKVTSIGVGGCVNFRSAFQLFGCRFLNSRTSFYSNKENRFMPNEGIAA